MDRAPLPMAARMLMNSLLAMVLAACHVPTAGSGVTMTPVVTLGQDDAGAARVRIQVPEGEGDRHVQALPASWNEAVVYFDSPTVRAQPYAFTIPRASFTQVTGGVIATLSATLTDAQDVVLDRNGNAYIADPNRVRKFNLTSGVTTVVAGTGAAGGSGDGGPATSAKLDQPESLALDAAGNLYIADYNNYRVRKVDATSGVITTYAGVGTSGYSGDGGLATSAKISGVEGLAVDAAGNLYIVDTNNNRVRKVDAVTKVITTVVGTGTPGYSGDGGPATSAQLSDASAVTLDAAGNLYLTECGNNCVRRVDAVTGVITTVAGTGAYGYSGDGGAATSAQLAGPMDVAVDAFGNLYIADCGNSRVRKVDAATKAMSTYAGTGASGNSGDGGAATSAQLAAPEGIWIDDAGNLFISDEGNLNVRKVTGTYAEFVASASSSPAMPVLRPATDYAISVDLRTSGSPATLEAQGYLNGQTLQAGPNTFNLSILNNLNVTTVTGEPTVRDGTGAAAFFENPDGVAVDAAGTYAYVADRYNNCIRRLEIATGIVTTVAGNGQIGSGNGSATSARFFHPTGVAIVGAHLYLTEEYNNSVRKIDLSLSPTDPNFVTTVAGNNGWGYVNGNAATAKLTGPEGLAVAADESAIYVADSDYNDIRKIDLTLAPTNANFVTTLVSTGLNKPMDVALDGAGNLYVTDLWNQRVRKIVLATKASSTLVSLGVFPSGITFDGTNLWVTEIWGSSRIRKVTLAGAVTVVAGGTGGFTDGTGAGAKLSSPDGLAVIPGGDLLIADQDNHAIRRMVRATGAVTTLAGSPAAGWVDGALASARFRSIYGVCVNRARTAMYVADTGNHRIRKIDLVTGTVSTIAGNGILGLADGVGTAAQFDTPFDVAVNDAGTTLYVSDLNNLKIRQIDLASGAVTTLAGDGNYGGVDGTGTAAEFAGPSGLDIDAAGNLYVADQYGHTIRKVTPAGVVTTIAGSVDEPDFVNGVGTAARFEGPIDVALDRMGNLFVADAYNCRIRRIKLATGEVTTHAGSGANGTANGPGASASFIEPWGVACDGGGNVYVADIYHNGVRKIARDGYVTTVAGGTIGYMDGARSTARFNGLAGLAVDTQGGLYVADTDNHVVRRIK